MNAKSGPRRPCPTGTAPSKTMSSGRRRLEWKASSRVGQREIDVHAVIRKHHARLRLIEDAGMEKRRHVAVDGLDVPADPPRHLADRQCALTGHRPQNLPPLHAEGFPKQIDRAERDMSPLLLAPDRGGGAA